MGPLTTTVVAVILGGAVVWQVYRTKGLEMPDWLQSRTARLRRKAGGDSTPAEAVTAPAAGEAGLAVAEVKSVPTDPPVEVVIMPEAKTTAPTAQESLEVIKGIGPVYARKLNAAGVVTFADLATTSVEQLRAIVAPEGQVVPHIETWIAQAAQLAAQPG